MPLLCNLARDHHTRSRHIAMAVRVRFAPSPTGALHIGGLRTALFNHFLARHHPDGKMILRIEDTDQTRLVPTATAGIIKSLRWAGVNVDEGPENGGPHAPYVQSQRSALYKSHAHSLLEHGHAYRCFCSTERLDGLRKWAQQHKRAFMYDKHCAGMSRAESDSLAAQGRPHTLRMAIPRTGKTTVNDLVYGHVEFDHGQLDDQVLLKSDGLPTYHLANVVDDHMMRITHVLRGEEWLSSTPKHILLYNAFGWAPPAFAHLPLLLDENRAKLSKRHRAADVAGLETDFLPEAVVNFVAQLGWTPPSESEVLTADELAQLFDIKHINKGASVVQASKLEWFNRQHIQRLASTEAGFHRLVSLLKPRVDTLLADPKRERIPERPAPDTEYITKAIRLSHHRITLLSDISTLLSYFFVEPEWGNAALIARRLKLRPDALAFCAQALPNTLSELQDWSNAEIIGKTIESALASSPAPLNASMLATRFLITGEQAGPSLASVVQLLSRDVVLRRLTRPLST